MVQKIVQQVVGNEKEVYVKEAGIKFVKKRFTTFRSDERRKV